MCGLPSTNHTLASKMATTEHHRVPLAACGTCQLMSMVSATEQPKAMEQKGEQMAAASPFSACPGPSALLHRRKARCLW